MSLTEIFLIAIGLSMDAFAVSISCGMAIRQRHVRHAFLVATFFGAFQAIMPLLGWALGRVANGMVSACDHWIAFALLAFVGGRMVVDALRHKDQAREKIDSLSLHTLFVLAVATSLDALAVGFSLSLLGVTIWVPALVIGMVCAVFTMVGLRLGRLVAAAARMERAAEAAGGLVLLAIGLRILYAHGALG